MRRSSVAVLRAQLRRGRWLWPLRQALKWPAHRIGDVLGQPLAGPILASWFTTYACNLRCRFCDLPGRAAADGRRPLARAEKLAVLEELAAIGTAAVGFTGGEPACDPDLESLVRAAVAHGLVTHLSTNGLAFASDGAATPLLEAGLHAVSFSIDGAAAATHDGLRGRDGSFAEAMGGLERALAARGDAPGLAISTATVVGPANLGELPRLVTKLESLGVDQIGFLPLHDFDRGGELLCPPLQGDDLRRLDGLVDLLLERRRGGTVENTPAYLAALRGAFLGRPFPVRCYAGLVSVVIDPWGDLYPCIPFAQLGLSAGNVRETPLRRFWAGEGARRMRAAARACRRCYWNCHAELSLLMAGPVAWRRREAIA